MKISAEDLKMKTIDEERKLVSEKKTTVLNGKKQDHEANGVEEGGDYVNEKIVDVDKEAEKDDGEDDEVDDEEGEEDEVDDVSDDDDLQKVQGIEKENGEGEDDVDGGVEYDEDDGPDSDDGDEDSDEDEDEDEDGEGAEYGVIISNPLIS